MKNKKLAKVYHYDLYGKRDEKYKFLDEKSIGTIEWNELDIREPDFYFVPKDFKSEQDYKKCFSLTSLMSNLNPGVESGRDDFFIDYNKSLLELKIYSVFSDKNSNEFRLLYGIKDTSSFMFKSNLESSKYDSNFIKKISYRPFDIRFTYYDRKLQRRASYDTFKHLLKINIGLVLKRGLDEVNSAPIFVVNSITDRRGWSRAGMQGAESITPLYLYPEAGEQATLDQSGEPTTPSFGHPSKGVSTTPSFGHPSNGGELGRQPNLDMKLVGEIAKGLGLEFRDVAPWDSTTPSFGHPSKE